MATGRLVSWASCGALAVWLLAGCGGSVAQAPKPAVAPVAKPAEITDVQVSGTGDAVQVTVIDERQGGLQPGAADHPAAAVPATHGRRRSPARSG